MAETSCRPVKRPNTNGEGPSKPTKRRAISHDEAVRSFRSGLLEDETRNQYQQKYAKSQPYKHGVIQNLLDPDLLSSVRKEITENISFTPKETDIYKIYQSGDLANLDGLDDESLKLLPSLQKIRDALYSAPFRDFLERVTGSGKLSGTKTDMAVNVYNPTCHLLCHDDVIGSRRVSYILYLTDPNVPWKAEWGGALRLYPTEKFIDEDGTEKKIPSPHPTTSIPPAFNQLSFFAVQPGESFHDVEEVYAAENEKETNGHADAAEAEKRAAKGKFRANVESNATRVRMAISGWFHIPQKGEDGYIEGEQEAQAAQSSLAQLQGNADRLDLPQRQWQQTGSNGDEQMAGTGEENEELTQEDLDELLQYMNPQLLTPDVVENLREAFNEELAVNLPRFLNAKFEATVLAAVKAEDTQPPNDTWTVARPPHKHRFLFRQPSSSTSASPINALTSTLFQSPAFRKWLCLACGVRLGDFNTMARRFRRGMDYTLATAYNEEQPLLEVCLGLTPSSGWGADEDNEEEEDKAGKGAEDAEEDEADDAGGAEVWMVGEDSDSEDDIEGDVAEPSSNTGAGKRREKANPAVYRQAGDSDDGEDDGILLTNPAAWNTLSIASRDRGTLKFVKYVSRKARGDRWDVVGEYRVVSMEERDGVEGEEGGDGEGEWEGLESIEEEDENGEGDEDD